LLLTNGRAPRIRFASVSIFAWKYLCLHYRQMQNANGQPGCAVPEGVLSWRRVKLGANNQQGVLE
jgi:hypothetical protein